MLLNSDLKKKLINYNFTNFGKMKKTYTHIEIIHDYR